MAKKMKCYTGTKECGCLVAVVCCEVSDEDLIEALRYYEKEGYKIKLMDVEKAREKLKFCKCEKSEESN